MRGIGKNKADDKWLVALGKHVEQLIKDKGYSSVYDFWINQAGDSMSRAALNYLVAGKTDPKATTLRILAGLLDVPPKKLLDF